MLNHSSLIIDCWLELSLLAIFTSPWHNIQKLGMDSELDLIHIKISRIAHCHYSKYSKDNNSFFKNIKKVSFAMRLILMKIFDLKFEFYFINIILSAEFFNKFQIRLSKYD